jgi:2-keto-4-pentenoate hydratase/2-oxohepta-3-ene-1,7-dioic acid hydratase in catechol pathway
MKLVTYRFRGAQRLGVLQADQGVLDLAEAARRFQVNGMPRDMLAFIEAGPDALEAARGLVTRTLDVPELWVALADAELCAPIPTMRKNVFGVGRNYKLHIEEGARARGEAPTYPAVPEFFSKPVTAVIGDGESIVLDPAVTRQLDYEVELGIVVGSRAKDLREGDALGAVFGYTIVNDVSARDAQRAHGQWFKGKCMDTYCPIGPCIVTADEFGPPSGHRLTTRVNGSTRQDSNTVDMLFNCEQILMWLSRGMTLEPGDIISTGTPSGVALGLTPQLWLQDGDVCELEIEGIGVLRNPVRQLR